MNLAEKVKFINIIRCVCSSCGIFCNCHEKKFASLANVHHYKIMFHTDLEVGFVWC